MASREKRPLVPSKSKQKANDSGLPSNELKNRKAKSLTNLKNQQLARDILEAVATGSQLPPKLEASLPHKKVLRNLKRKQKLRVAKANLIKSKITRRVANKNLCRINSDIKRGLRTKRLRLTEGESSRRSESTSRVSDNIDTESESTSNESPHRTIRLRTKRTKLTLKAEAESEDNQETQDNQESEPADSSKISPKFSRGRRYTESPDSTATSAKATKFVGFRRNKIRQRGGYTRSTESRRGRRPHNKEGNYIANSKAVVDTKFSKSLVDSKNSIDLTIDEVIASMLSDSEIENQQEATEKVEGKITRSRKMLVEESVVGDIEIKKEPESDDKVISDGEYTEVEQGLHQNAIQLRKRSNITISQRSLRNGKLRQHSDSGIPSDFELKRHKRLNSDDPVASETSIDQASDCNVDTESCFSESSGNDSQSVLTAAKEEACSAKQDGIKNSEDGTQLEPEIENNNNSDRLDRASEIGPTLRSKTKAKSTEGEAKSDDIKVEYVRIAQKCTEVPEEQKKANSLDQVRKDTILAKFSEKSKTRRSSLNIDMKKTVNSFYGSDKSEGNPKSQIDQMIENIKLTIAKSIESKIFGPEKGLGLSKNFDIPKTEEIIAPLSAESQKLGLEDNVDEDKSNTSKTEMKSDSTENSVPKVADTAKEIEKLVMGDIELAETHSQNVQDSESSDRDGSNNVPEDTQPAESVIINKNTGEQQQEDTGATDSEKSMEDLPDSQSKSSDDSKRTVSIRKSPRISDKSSSESGSPESQKKVSRLTNKSQKSESTEELNTDNRKVPVSNEMPLNCDSPKSETGKKLEEPLKKDAESMKEESTALGESEGKSSKEEIRQQSDTAELIISQSVSDNPEESETLESISQEVEKLLDEDHSIDSSEINTDEQKKPKEEESTPYTVVTCRASEPDSESDHPPLAPDESPEEIITETTVTSCKSNTPNKCDQSNDTKETDGCNSEATQCTKKNKHNSHLTITGSCDDLHSEKDITESNDSNTSPDEDTKRNDDQVKMGKDAEGNPQEDTTIGEVSEGTESEAITRNPGQSESGTQEENEKVTIGGKSSEEQKSPSDENRRVLRARDRSKKNEKRQPSSSRERVENSTKIKVEEDQKSQNFPDNSMNSVTEDKSEPGNLEDLEDAQSNADMDQSDLMEPQGRTRRSREVKRRKEEQLSNSLKTKRAKREIRKSDQQNKEETLLDNEVAKINENNRSFLNKFRNGNECTETFRGFSEGGREVSENIQVDSDNVRSKSENDLTISTEVKKTTCEGRLSRNLSEDRMSKKEENIDTLDVECKAIKTPETSQKDSDEASTSGESSSSANATPKILETPEDKAKKESILRLLGLESLEKAAERLNHQKARKEQYTGTLKTVIRVQKEKEKDKRMSRSPLKMVLKQGRGDGEGDSPEFYTIQKEFGTSGLGDSSSGANRKFTTNHRHSCDEDNEDAAPKDRQSLVIPEKSSSFSIHPGRLCADVCCYCFGKFGSLDTPMHLAQMKSDERRKKILSIERHLTKDSCLCDACYRHVDRKANTSPTNMQAKPQKQHRQLMVSKCTARECRDPARHHVKRRWLLKIKAGLQNQVDIDWDASQHTSLSFCVTHYSKIERFLTCALCTRRLARNHTHQLATAEIDELNQLLGQQNIPVLLVAGTFVCKLCRYFTQLQLKYKDLENMGTNHRSFFKSYRKRILHYHDIEVLENEEEDSSQNQSKDKRKKAKCPQPKSGPSKSPDVTMNSASEKSTPEPTKNEGVNSETDNENRNVKSITAEDNIPTDVQYLSIENAVEKLKKRKMLDLHSYSTESTMSCDGSNEVVEILAMDKEVTLTRLPKRPRTSNDITPVVQRLGANPSISVRTLFPGEEEMNLHANIEFTNVREVTPQGWEKCATMIQYDRDTKLLWQELQRPYGNQSSFLRHLILLEKYYRAGDLVLAPNASRNAINYSTSVQNRLISYEGPEKMDEPIMEPIASEYSNSRRLSGGFVVERDRLSLPSTSSSKPLGATIQSSSKGSPPRVLKLNPGVSIIKKPPPNLQRLNIPSTSTSNGNAKRKDGQKVHTNCSGKMYQMTEPELKRLQTLKRQKQMLAEKQPISPGSGSGGSSNSPPSYKSATQYQKAQLAAQTQFQKHLRMQQEMLNRQSRGDFEPLICDVRSLANENSPTQNLLHNLNLPKSIQVTTKPSNPIPILPKIPKSLTVIPQTVTRPSEK